MKKLFLLLICSIGLFTYTNAQSLILDGDFESHDLIPSSSKIVNADQPGWSCYWTPETIKVPDTSTPDILNDSIITPNPLFKGLITRVLENGNHYIHVDPIALPSNSGFDMMLWQEVFDLPIGAYEIRFRARTNVTSFQSNVINPVFPGIQLVAKDITFNSSTNAYTFTNLTTYSTINMKELGVWKTFRQNFTVTKSAATTRIFIGFDRFCSLDIDDVELIPLPDIIPTFKNTATKTNQNEGLADFELGNYPSTMSYNPTSGNTIAGVFTAASPITYFGNFLASAPTGNITNLVNSYGANTIAPRLNGVASGAYLNDTVFWSPFIAHGADPMQGGASWRAEVRGLTTDSLNAYLASISTPCFDVQGSNGVARKVKLIFWAHTEGKDMLLRVDNISGSGTSTAGRKVQNVLVSGTQYKEYVVNDTMPAIMPNQQMNSLTVRPTPRYRLCMRTPHSVLHLDYMRLENWDGTTSGTPDYKTAVNSAKSDVNYAKIANSGGNIIVAAIEPVSVSVYNLSGALVKQQNLNGNRLIFMEGKKGIFIVKAVGKNGHIVQKVIVE